MPNTFYILAILTTWWLQTVDGVREDAPLFVDGDTMFGSYEGLDYSCNTGLSYGPGRMPSYPLWDAATDQYLRAARQFYEQRDDPLMGETKVIAMPRLSEMMTQNNPSPAALTDECDPPRASFEYRDFVDIFQQIIDTLATGERKDFACCLFQQGNGPETWRGTLASAMLKDDMQESFPREMVCPSQVGPPADDPYARGPRRRLPPYGRVPPRGPPRQPDPYATPPLPPPYEMPPPYREDNSKRHILK